MRKKSRLAEQFATLQDERDRIETAYLKLKSEYFADRRMRAKRGEELEPLLLTDSAEWSTQLGREAIARSNAESDREARRDPHTRSLFGENADA